MMTWYDDAMRTIVELKDDQIRALADYCQRKRVSRAEAIRRGVEALLGEEDQLRERRAASLKATFGMWKDRGIDTDTYLAELRSEWDR
jgi:metal-responsive CopG/Arc/MetJ family transcriptional regulator